MKKYKLMYFKAFSNKLMDFLEEHKKQLKRLKNDCWGSFVHFERGYYPGEVGYNWFFLYDNGTIVANASTTDRTVFKYSTDIETYTLKHISELKVDPIKDIELDKNQRILFPMVESLCRNKNPKYKGAGRQLLQEIEKFYKKKGLKYLFLIPESIVFRSQNINLDCGVVKNKKKYLESQKNLISYYNAHGFKRYSRYYGADLCDESSRSLWVFFPVMRKKI